MVAVLIVAAYMVPKLWGGWAIFALSMTHMVPRVFPSGTGITVGVGYVLRPWFYPRQQENVQIKSNNSNIDGCPQQGCTAVGDVHSNGAMLPQVKNKNLVYFWYLIFVSCQSCETGGGALIFPQDNQLRSCYTYR